MWQGQDLLSETFLPLRGWYYWLAIEIESQPRHGFAKSICLFLYLLNKKAQISLGFSIFLEIRNVAEKTYSNDEEYIEILVLFNQMELESHVWQAATEISS